jgi:glycine/D-amino acid oxidase-like deaminating enzyme
MQTSNFASGLWTETACPAPETPPLDGARKADVVVVGGGYTGLSAALHLAEEGADVVLLEAETLGFGASGRNNGQVIPTYTRHNPDDVVRAYGAKQGERLNRWVGGSADLVFDLIRRHDIACDATQQGWLQPAHAASRLAGLRAKHDQWAARGAAVEMVDRDTMATMTGSPIYHGGWMNRSGGHIQPLSYARGLAHAAILAGASVRCQSPALEIRREDSCWRILTPRGTVDADTILLATNAYTDALWPGLAQSIVPVRSFHIATTPLSANIAATVLPGGHGFSDTRQSLWAFRKDRNNRLVTTCMPFTPFGARRTLQRSTLARLRQAYPQINDTAFDYVWDGKVAMTTDRLPRYHELAPGIHTGLGYSGRGIAIGTAMGRFLADRALKGRDTEPPVPTAPLKTLPLHDLIVPLSRFLVLYYRWRDARA